MSRPALEHTAEIADELRAAKRWLIILDFDGTLAPIVEHPDVARMPELVRGTLHELSRQPAVTLAVTSGRAIRDLRLHVGLNVILAGNHGLEIEGPGIFWSEPAAEALRGPLHDLAAVIAARIRPIPGAWVEEKGLTASVHFRRVAPQYEREIELLVSLAVDPFADQFILHPGKKILEIRPRLPVNKGTAALRIRQVSGGERTLPFCIGDDETDEDMFEALADGLTFRVGEGEPTAARFHVASALEVSYLLILALEVSQNRSSADRPAG